ncbi:diguanylate cyclase [Herbaspirillum sp. AP02]|uniref:diguanylate cyclase domain-containing protein n=1 Tax=unclassified Herbaspirillum TaxID=2624150 RepID=UPI0015DA38B2|nr:MULTISPECIES: diguanylate cyclase [unclassified Herbaspirillum]MBG7619979.1 diguanylate cyclase [Herbaspirillum sp. AP02]NZD69231.1 diguanylate cyclase [Herbaspirillum sp. AP21]
MKIKRIHCSLVTRLTLFGIMLIAVSAVLRYHILIDFLEKEQAQVAADQQSTIASYLAQDIGYRVQERTSYLERLASHLPPALLQDHASLRAWLQEHQQLQPLFAQGLFVADGNGMIVVDYPTLNGRRALSLTRYADYERVLQGATVLCPPLSSPASGKPIMAMLTPLRDASGRIVAILGGSSELNAPGFLDHLQQARLGPTGSFLLVSPQQKMIIASSDEALMFTQLPPAGRDVLMDQALAGYRGNGVGIAANGVNEIKAFASVPGTPWLVAVTMPLAAALPTVQRTRALIARGGVIQGFMVVLLLVLAYLWFFRPLRRAAALADRMTRGELPMAPLPVERRDEVGHLTMAFNGLLTRLKLHQAELQHQAHHDVLTGLPNRMMLAERMEAALTHACRERSGVALLFLDLDGFKPINDTLGHKAGDLVLQEVTRRLRQVARHGDTLARVGGDEFVLLVTDLGQPYEHGAQVLAEKCIKAVSEPLHLAQGEYQLGVSVGIAVCDGSCDADSLLQAADKAMYAAKGSGRGCYVIAPARAAGAGADITAPEGTAGTTRPAGSAHS